MNDKTTNEIKTNFKHATVESANVKLSQRCTTSCTVCPAGQPASTLRVAHSQRIPLCEHAQ